ncbi:hypothetical protein GTO27_09295 [Candidatus Bathyarchaeota archaeon]|nr:hypothetical protein [Candidatus Bathyarchaeota archaeon]
MKREDQYSKASRLHHVSAVTSDLEITLDSYISRTPASVDEPFFGNPNPRAVDVTCEDPDRMEQRNLNIERRMKRLADETVKMKL